MRLRNYWIWKKFTFNSKREFCDQFVMEEWQTIRGLFGGKDGGYLCLNLDSKEKAHGGPLQ